MPVQVHIWQWVVVGAQEISGFNGMIGLHGIGHWDYFYRLHTSVMVILVYILVNLRSIISAESIIGGGGEG